MTVVKVSPAQDASEVFLCCPNSIMIMKNRCVPPLLWGNEERRGL